MNHPWLRSIVRKRGSGCVQFFDCLGCEPEVGALLDVIGFVRNGQPKAMASN